jgi:MtaA/CmuA family methyltransferase
MDLVVDPDYLRVVLEKAFRWNVEFAQEAVSAGADVIVLVDATASGDILSPEQYEEFAQPYEKRLVQVVRDAGAASILHICGNTRQNLPLMKATGADGVSVDQSMDMRWVKRTLGRKVAAVGNVSPTNNPAVPFPRVRDRGVQGVHRGRHGRPRPGMRVLSRYSLGHT